MGNNRWITAILLSCMTLPATTAWSQFGVPRKFQSPNSVISPDRQVETERTQRWRAGLRIEAKSGPCAGIYGTFSVPVDWPEQDVKVVDEEVSETVQQTRYRNLSDGVRQMIIVATRLAYGEHAEAAVTYEITRRTQPVPLDTASLQIPSSAPNDVRKHLSNSPMIDARNARIRMQAKELTADVETDWGKVEAIYNWVKREVEYTYLPLQGSVETLDKKKGNHEDLAGLFVALCRASKVPARIVWVPNYCYAEFYLEQPAEQRGEEAQGNWYPCEFKEESVFGMVSEPYIILQKGDNIRVPESKDRKRFVAEFVKVKSGVKPTVVFIRDVLGAQ